MNQVWVNPAVKSANPSHQTMGCRGEKRNGPFDRGGLIKKGRGFDRSLRPESKGGEKRRGKEEEEGGQLSFQLHTSQARPWAVAAAARRAAHCLWGLSLRVRPKPPGTPRGSALLCTCSLEGRYEEDRVPHRAPASTRALTPYSHFLFSVSVYTWLLSKQSKHMSHFPDRWFQPRAT